MAEKRLIEYWFVAAQIEKLHMDAFRRRDKAQSVAYRKVEDILTNAPTIDAVPVVRCRDCKHWLKDFAGCSDIVGRCEWANYAVGANGYCLYGEPKGDADHG